MSTNETATHDGCEVSKTTDVWEAPFPDYDKYGRPTGALYHRCRDCGREVHEAINREHVSHRDGCRFE